jgi:hypothetical protein
MFHKFSPRALPKKKGKIALLYLKIFRTLYWPLKDMLLLGLVGFSNIPEALLLTEGDDASKFIDSNSCISAANIPKNILR